MNSLKSNILIIVIFIGSQHTISQVVARPIPKPGFEKRITEAVNSIRLIDTHEHLISEKEALAGVAYFSTLFINYQLEDLISSGAPSDQLYSVFKSKDKSLDEKWGVFKNFWGACLRGNGAFLNSDSALKTANPGRWTKHPNGSTLP